MQDLATDAGEGTTVSPFVESFDAFYGREVAGVTGLAYVLSGSRAAAEDLSQEAFLAAYRRWDRIARYDDPAAWVRRVAANRAVSRFRRLGAEARALARLVIVADRHLPQAFDADTAEIWEQVRKLPKRQAQAIALAYVEELTYREIAAVLECSTETVKTHLQRARKTLARRLDLEDRT